MPETILVVEDEPALQDTLEDKKVSDFYKRSETFLLDRISPVMRPDG